MLQWPIIFTRGIVLLFLWSAASPGPVKGSDELLALLDDRTSPTGDFTTNLGSAFRFSSKK